MSTSSSSSKNEGKTASLAVVCTGTRYDIQQHISLAVLLKNVGGFKVKLITHAAYSDIATKYGLLFHPLKGNPSALMKSSAFRDAIAENSLLKIASIFKKEADTTIEANMTAIHEAIAKGVNPCDGIICSIAVLTECLAIGQKYQRPVILAPLLPYSPSGELPLAQMVPEPSKYTFLNRLSYEVSGALLWTYLSSTYNRFRTKTLGIGPQAAYELEGVPQVAAFSPYVVPPPLDWGNWIHVTGHWSISESDEQVSLANPLLATMLGNATGIDLLKRPIVINFEGVPLPDPIGFLRAARSLATKMGTSIIFCAGDADMAASMRSPRLADMPDIVFELPNTPAVSAALPTSSTLAAASSSSGSASSSSSTPSVSAVPRILIIANAPYSYLFSRASIAIHQGGAAITQAAMAAGIPSIAFPAFGEQHFWAARIGALSVGPPVHYPLREIASKLEECVTIARQPVIVAAAAQLGLSMEASGDGTVAAVMTIRDILNRPQHRHCGVICNWEPDESRQTCSLCNKPFTLLNRRRHCRSCGRLACTNCFIHRCHLPGYPENSPQITCERCLDHRRAYFAMHVGEACVPEIPNNEHLAITSHMQSNGSGNTGAASNPVVGSAVKSATKISDEFAPVDLVSGTPSNLNQKQIATPGLLGSTSKGGGSSTTTAREFTSPTALKLDLGTNNKDNGSNGVI